MSNQNCLQIADELTSGDRNVDYGHPLDDFTKTVNMINAAYTDLVKDRLAVNEPMFQPEDWPMIMQFCKISREINSPKADNIVDGAGYWRTLEMVKDEQLARRSVITSIDDLYKRDALT